MSARWAPAVGAPDTASERRTPAVVDPWYAAANAVELACALFDAQVVGLFAHDHGRLVLRASHALTQDALDAVSEAWTLARPRLDTGMSCERAEPPALVLPCGDERGLAGLVYIEGIGVRRPSNLPLLVPLSQVLVRVLRGVGGDTPLLHDGEHPATGNADAATLYVLMERNEWNVARVARLTGVTRMTIYNRLRRAGVQRRRVAKAARRGRRAPRPPSPDADKPTAS